MHLYKIKNGQKNANTFNEFFKSFFVDLNERVPAVSTTRVSNLFHSQKEPTLQLSSSNVRGVWRYVCMYACGKYVVVLCI